MGRNSNHRCQHQSGSERWSRVALDPAAIQWVVVARAFSTKTSTSVMGALGEGTFGKGGEKDADGRGGREEAVGEVIERVRRDPGLDEHERRLLTTN